MGPPRILRPLPPPPPEDEPIQQESKPTSPANVVYSVQNISVSSPPLPPKRRSLPPPARLPPPPPPASALPDIPKVKGMNIPQPTKRRMLTRKKLKSILLNPKYIKVYHLAVQNHFSTSFQLNPKRSAIVGFHQHRRSRLLLRYLLTDPCALRLCLRRQLTGDVSGVRL
ncbi:hypothetical protein SCHPADRAFT_603680 [Schizopora paradoxa]|uniref:Uncharacterized protein n=1 Tax=Schizopora paradoxa TaxID=27342 RepID=A0A0H2R9N7_9AGAM|nr:hypothetical protein SCHPADRAFT_603680 [Schizopora paradoxa]